MKIAILGWGSLIPHPRNLSLNGGWSTDGPELEIEFSRISDDGRLTLVIDPRHGSTVKTLYAESGKTLLQEAVENLRSREKTTTDKIGTCVKGPRSPGVPDHIYDWLHGSSFDAVIWTNLESNYKQKLAKDFCVQGAFDYLDGLSPAEKMNARNYIVEAPKETKTELREYLAKKGWL
jgi:hypothetical protein